MLGRWARLGLTAGLIGIWSAISPARGNESEEARNLLRRAFALRYNCGELMTVELTTRNRFGEEMRRAARVASKRIGDRCHAIARMHAPDFLRGTALLTIDRVAKGNDQFLFLPSLGRVRRITAAQRADSFLGTDLSYEDLERLRVEDYELILLPAERIGGEEAHVISATPRSNAAYHRAEFYVAREDFAILEARYYRREEVEPFKVIRTSRADLGAFPDRLIPVRIWVHNRRRGTVTEVQIRDLVLDPLLDDGFFSMASLESGRPIPDVPAHSR